MKRIYKRIILLFILLFMFLLPNHVHAGSFLVYDMHFDAIINEDGSMNVTETWKTNINNTNTLFKEFKADSTRYTGVTDAQVYEVVDGKDVKLTEIDELMYHVTDDCYYGMINDNGNFEIAWGTGLESSSDKREYKIKYKIIDAVTTFKDASELYWQFLGKDSQNTPKITGDIWLPDNNYEIKDFKVWGHSQGLQGEVDYVANNHIVFNLNNLVHGDILEIRTLFPKDISSSERVINKKIVKEAVKEETKWANQANFKRNLPNYILTFLLVILPNIGVLVIIKNCISSMISKYRTIQYHKLKVGNIRHVNKVQYYRDIPRENSSPSQACLLFKGQKIGKFKSKDIENIFSATILDLILNGIIKLETKPNDYVKGNFIISIKNKALAGKLPKEERDILDYLVTFIEDTKPNVPDMKALKKYIKKYPYLTDNLICNIKSHTLQSLEKEGLAIEDSYDAYQESFTLSAFAQNIKVLLVYLLMFGIFFAFPMFLISGGGMGIHLEAIPEMIKIMYNYFGFYDPLVVIMIIAIILNILFKIIEPLYINFITQKGLEEAEKWHGLKRFMESYSLLDEKDIPDIVLWEKYLVYATVFGVADKIINKVKKYYPDFDKLLDSDKAIFLNYADIGLYTRSISYEINKTVHSYNHSSIFSSSGSSSSYRSSSGSGSGGGFSGGGGGGGGRRRLRRQIKINIKIKKALEISLGF